MRKLAITLATVGALAAPAALANSLATQTGGPETNLAGVYQAQLKNAFSEPARYAIRVLDPDTLQPIDETLWRSTIEGDQIELQPLQKQRFAIQLRHRGMHVLLCSENIGTTFGTRTCAHVTYGADIE